MGPSEMNNEVCQFLWEWVSNIVRTAGNEVSLMKDEECCDVRGELHRTPGLPRTFLGNACFPGLNTMDLPLPPLDSFFFFNFIMEYS